MSPLPPMQYALTRKSKKKGGLIVHTFVDLKELKVYVDAEVAKKQKEADTRKAKGK